MEVTLRFRPATMADLELLRRWDEEPHVIASDPNDDWGWEAELCRSPDWREQLIAEVEGGAVGFVQIIDPQREESHYWGDVTESARDSRGPSDEKAGCNSNDVDVTRRARRG